MAAPCIRVLAVDDHAMLRDGIASMLKSQADLMLVGEAESGKEGIEQFRALRPDVTLMDLRLPDMSGIEAMRAIRAEFPDAKIIMLTTFSGDAQVSGAMRQGASGYLLKSALRKELRDAIRGVYAGRRIVQAALAIEVAQHVADDALTSREIAVLTSAAQGNSNKLIASALDITEDTVKAHMKSILAKLGANDRTQAVVAALKRGIIEV